jgi:hypothetical protein
MRVLHGILGLPRGAIPPISQPNGMSDLTADATEQMLDTKVCGFAAQLTQLKTETADGIRHRPRTVCLALDLEVLT